MDLDDLQSAYQSVIDVNIGIAARIRAIDSGDARVNTVVALDLFARALLNLLDKGIDHVEKLFEEGKPPPD